MSRPVLIIFARDPVPGMVKTRLIPLLGEGGACALYVKLLQRTLKVAMQCPEVDIELWTDTKTPSATLCSLLAEHSIRPRYQQPGDLGQRMHHAISDALSRSGSVVLIGADCPDWRAQDLAQALGHLQRHDVVLAPAMDGGYVLIGCRRNVPELFSDIPWGSDQVFEKTKRRLQALDLVWQELPAHPDIDIEPDLKLVPELLE